MINRNELIEALASQAPPVLRWAGAVARQLRQYDIAVGGKSSGFSNTDALTLADLSVQELLVAALRDGDPIFRRCRIEAEEVSGDLGRFADDSDYVIALDPIDGTKQYRDRTGDGWSVMLHLRTASEVLYSLVAIPSGGSEGRWVEARGDAIRVGDDDPSRPARAALDALPVVDRGTLSSSRDIYMIGFVGRERESVAAVTAAGLTGVDADEAPGCLYDLMATGAFGGSLIHSPNVYDFPVSVQLARQLGGDSVFVRTGESVHFRDLWLDERSKMQRLRGIVATAVDRAALPVLCDVARTWSEDRYGGTN
ncbi:MAG: inositol monophosphatase family protein [Planctomycetaceae bacterium]